MPCFLAVAYSFRLCSYCAWGSPNMHLIGYIGMPWLMSPTGSRTKRILHHISNFYSIHLYRIVKSTGPACRGGTGPYGYIFISQLSCELVESIVSIGRDIGIVISEICRELLVTSAARVTHRSVRWINPFLAADSMHFIHPPFCAQWSRDTSQMKKMC